MANSSDGTFTTSATPSSPPPGPSGPSGPSGTGLTADAGEDQEGTVGSTISFTGSASGGTEPYTYAWDFGDDGTGTGASTSHVYSSTGTYTVTLTATDADELTGTDTATVTISEAEAVNNPPTISSIYHSPTKVTSEDTVTIYATVTDDNSVSSVKLYWNDGSDHSTSMSASGNTYSAQIGPFSSGTYVTYSVAATDDRSKTTQSSTYVFTVIVVATVGDVTSGEETEITPENTEEAGIDEISFTAASDLKDVKITMEKLDDIPEDITETPTTPTETEEKYVYAYLEIEITAENETVEEDDIESLKIKFKVEQPWLEENGIEKDTVVLVRYYNNEWQELPTTILYEDTTYVYYQATATGTSTFAIVGSKIIEVPEEPTEPALPWFIIIGGVIAAMVIVIVILFKAGFIYVERDQKKFNEKINKEDEE